MLLLAQVQPKSNLQAIEFLVLARQLHESRWLILDNHEHITASVQTLLAYTSPDLLLREGELYLVRVADNQDVIGLEDAIPFILELLRDEGNVDLRAVLGQQEANLAEEWRQRLTLQTQELSRQRVEVEARRVQLQQMEETLRKERQALEQKQLEMEMQLELLKNSHSPLD